MWLASILPPLNAALNALSATLVVSGYLCIRRGKTAQHKNMPTTPERVGVFMRRVLKAAGLRTIRPHDLRHTYATLAIKAGVDILAVSRQLRHASIAITADVYAHAVPGANRAAADVMEGILTRKTSNHLQPPRNQVHERTT